jgi:inorganic pyrophosphatase
MVFIPKTLPADSDPLDVFGLCQLSVSPLCIPMVKPIGFMPRVDCGVPDDKIISVCEVSPYKLAIIEQFVEKQSVNTFRPIGVEKANWTIRDGHMMYPQEH